jgi:hypothetical protein
VYIRKNELDKNKMNETMHNTIGDTMRWTTQFDKIDYISKDFKALEKKWLDHE